MQVLVADVDGVYILKRNESMIPFRFKKRERIKKYMKTHIQRLNNEKKKHTETGDDKMS